MATPFLQPSTIRKRLRKNMGQRNNLQAVFDREMRKLKAEADDIRARCEHDPEDCRDGYGEYWQECKVCGMESRGRIRPDAKRAKEVQKLQARPTVGRR